MCILNKYTNQKGMTLVELLAVVVIFSIISIFLFNLVTKAMENTNNISLETQLRDEADIIVSQFIKKLYSIQQEDIIYNVTDAQGSYLQITTDRTKCERNLAGGIINPSICNPTLYKIGFEKNPANANEYILRLNNTTTYKPMTEVKILSTSKIIGDPLLKNVYEIKLDLTIKKKYSFKVQEKSMQFTNSVRPITNK